MTARPEITSKGVAFNTKTMDITDEIKLLTGCNTEDAQDIYDYLMLSFGTLEGLDFARLKSEIVKEYNLIILIKKLYSKN